MKNHSATNHSLPGSTRQQVRRVLVITLLLNLAVAVSKVIVGVWSGALAITADGFHSLVDASSNIAALIANYLASRPPDANHPYGHRRFETIAALGIGAFLLLTAWEILSSALERLSNDSPAVPDISPLAVGVMIITLCVNILVSSYEAREGRRLRSELLTADAAHTRTDIFVSLSVLVSLALVALLNWVWMDTFAALVIVVLIFRAAWGVLGQTASVLVDTAPYTPEQLIEWVGEIPAAGKVIRARSRGPSDAVHVDIDLEVRPETTADHTAAIADTLRRRLFQQITGLAEIEVHFTPAAAAVTDYSLSARAHADALGLSTHEVRVTEGEHGKILEMHVEVQPGQTLDAAHHQVTQLERSLCVDLPGIAEVVTHIEPAQEQTNPAVSPLNQQLSARITDLLNKHYPDYNWHHCQLYRWNHDYSVILHVGLPPQISVEAAHHIAENAELLLRGTVPEIARVTIHTEPYPS